MNQTALDIVSKLETSEFEGRDIEVINAYMNWLACGTNHNRHLVLFNLAVKMSDIDAVKSEALYREAVALKPDFIEAWFNLGSIIDKQGRKEHAIIIWKSIIDQPFFSKEKNLKLYTLVLNNLGRVSEEIKDFENAEIYLFKSLEANKDQPKVIHHYVHLRQKQCRWPTFPDLDFISKPELIKSTSALALLSSIDEPGIQLAAGLRYTKEKINIHQHRLSPQKYHSHKKIKLGFLSGDLRMHAVSFLMVELFEEIDKSKFELYAYSWSKKDGSTVQKRIIESCDQFIDISFIDDLTAANKIRDDEIDILFDLQGLTAGARPNILATKPAPIIINYLGFPGTSGSTYADYIIADKYVIPENMQPYYSETPIYLPIFQCSDNKREVGITKSKIDYNIPEESFVYASMNNNHKYTEDIFECWLRIIKATDKSILWLLSDNDLSKRNMIAKAKEYNLEDRLFFTERLIPTDYLARYKVIDLFLDTYPFNGGTTVNDALYMGTPVLTLSGKTFASRMAGSLLKFNQSAGWIAKNIKEYEKLAIKARTKQLHKLKRGYNYNTYDYTRALEDQLLKIYPAEFVSAT